MLTSRQLNTLRHDLRTLAHIEYEEVENELLDHYATLTEQKMAGGQDFAHASSYAWAELGAGPGLNRIQRKFEESIRKQVAARHRQILMGYFRWPTVVTTVLIGILVFLITPIVPGNAITGFLWVAVLLPIAVFQYAYFKGEDQQPNHKKIIWRSIHARSVWLTSLINPVLISTSGHRVELLRTYTSLSAVVCFLIMLYLASIFQLYREHFRYKTA